MVVNVSIQMKDVGKIGRLGKVLSQQTDINSGFLARELQRRAKISFSRQFQERTGTTKQSIRARRVKKGIWKVTAGDAISKSFIQRLEAGRSGKDIPQWHFVRKEGAGHFGEGYSRPGGVIRKPHQKGKFMEDSFKSVKRDSKNIAEKRIKNALKRRIK